MIRKIILKSISLKIVNPPPPPPPHQKLYIHGNEFDFEFKRPVTDRTRCKTKEKVFFCFVQVKNEVL